MARAPLPRAVGLLLAGCINMSSRRNLAPGASAEAIRAQLGEPTGRYALPGGRRASSTRAGPMAARPGCSMSM